MRTQVKRAFTLIEILIVVVILGILAAIVIPQFTDASQQASQSSVVSQLQTIRGQIELFRVRNSGNDPDLTNTGWADLITPPAGQRPYLQTSPRNPLMPVGPTQDTVGAAGSGAAWIFEPSLNGSGVNQIYGWDPNANGGAGAEYDENGDGNPG
jgi:general secretion pathway protein G